jgi:hypothetical protein
VIDKSGSVSEELAEKLLPLIPPPETKALIERMNISSAYVKKCHEQQEQVKKLTAGLKKLVESDKAENFTQFLDSVQQLTDGLHHLPYEQEKQQKEAIQALRKELTEKGKLSLSTCKELLTNTSKLLQPTLYGLSTQMFSQLNFFVYLTTMLEVDRQKLKDPSIEKLGEIRKGLLLETISGAINFGHTQCRDILDEAVKKGIISEADPQYTQAKEEMLKCVS